MSAVTAVARHPDTSQQPGVASERERELLDRIQDLEAKLARRDEHLREFCELMERIRRHIAIEREVTDRALRRRYWWW